MKVVHNISVEAFMYPTEDLKKVRKALDLILPEKAKLGKRELESYYGPAITKLTYRTDKAAEIKKVLERITSALTREERKAVVESLDDRMDDNGCLFLRFDKQKAYSGELALAYKGDTIKAVIKVAAFPATLQNIRYMAKILFE